jgi:hypothetical protein
VTGCDWLTVWLTVLRLLLVLLLVALVLSIRVRRALLRFETASRCLLDLHLCCTTRYSRSSMDFRAMTRCHLLLRCRCLIVIAIAAASAVTAVDVVILLVVF